MSYCCFNTHVPSFSSLWPYDNSAGNTFVKFISRMRKLRQKGERIFLRPCDWLEGCLRVHRFYCWLYYL